MKSAILVRARAVCALPFVFGTGLLGAPAVNAPVAAPAILRPGVATSVTVTVSITTASGDPQCLGATLLRTNASGQALGIVGVMRDDGTGGDVVAADGVYTLQFTAAEPAGTLYLQASAAFRGMLARIKSPLTSITVREPLVGPEGGRLEFPNGVVLDIPPGALGAPTLIEVADIPVTREAIDDILAERTPATHQKRYLGGFTAKPKGLRFYAPITATFPIQPPAPGGVPTYVELNLAERKYLLQPTDLVYDRESGLVRLQMTEFGSAPAQLAVRTAGAEEVGEESDTTIVQVTPGFNPDDVCTTKKIRVVSREGDVANRKCQIIGQDLTVTFLDCPGSPMATVRATEASSDCPPHMKVSAEIRGKTFCYRCGKESLRAFVSATDPDKGDAPVINPTEMDAEWTSANPNVAFFPDPFRGDIQAPDEGIAATTGITARPPFRSVAATASFRVDDYPPMAITPAVPAPLPVGDTLEFKTSVKDLCGPPAATPCKVTWGGGTNSAGTVIARVDADGTVTGVTPGDTVITALSDFCGQRFTAEVPVKVVPGDYVVRARIASCDWNARFCAFPFTATNVPLTVLVTRPDGRPLANANVQLGLTNPVVVNPSSGRTNGKGEFHAEVYGPPRIRPYIIAQVSARFAGGEWKNTEVRGISTDICAEGRIEQADYFTAPFGEFTWGSFHSEGFGASGTLLPKPGIMSASMSASVTASCPKYENHRGSWYLDGSAGWYDTIVLVPLDLRQLENLVFLPVRLDTVHTGYSTVSGTAGAQSRVTFGYMAYGGGWGTGAADIQCFPNSGPSSWFEATTGCTPSQVLFELPLGIPHRVWTISSGAMILAWAQSQINGDRCSASSASIRLDVSQTWVPLPTRGYVVFSCSGNLSVGSLPNPSALTVKP